MATLGLLRSGDSVGTLLEVLEKPPGLSVAETEELRDAALASGALAMVGYEDEDD